MLTKEQIRGFLDQMSLSSRIDEDGDLMIALDPDENFGHPVLISIIVEPNRVSFIGSAVGYETPSCSPTETMRAATIPLPWSATARCAWSIQYISARKFPTISSATSASAPSCRPYGAPTSTSKKKTSIESTP